MPKKDIITKKKQKKLFRFGENRCRQVTNFGDKVATIDPISDQLSRIYPKRIKLQKKINKKNLCLKKIGADK